MEVTKLIEFMSVIEKLKCNTRHSWTSSGRQESVAEHSWRLALIAYFVKDEFPDINMDKVIKMSLIHDFGEAITGDIPAFYKEKKDELVEEAAVSHLLSQLPEELREELASLFGEMRQLETREAKLLKGLDKMEAVMQHNEADISTWLPLEYDLQLTYGEEEVRFSQYLLELKRELNENSIIKIKEKEQLSEE
jgi:putative hydrolase of HD superfamily